MAKCKYCQQEITWMKEGRKNVPVNPDGGTHACDEKKMAIESLKKIEVKTLTPEEIKRYEQAINEKANKK